MGKLYRHAAVLAAGAIVSAILAPVFAKALTPAAAPSFAPDDASVGESRLLIKAVFQYVQDNDEKLPPTDTVAHFQAAMSAYAPSTSVFTSPATHLAYQPNPAIGGHSIAEYTSLGTVVAFQDARTPSDSKFTVTYLDGHVEQGGGAAGGGTPAGDPDKVCADHVKAISLAMLQYLQDNDETYPPIETPAQVQPLLLPYTKSTSVFICPSTGQGFIYNTRLSGTHTAAIENPATTVVVADAVTHSDGVRIIGYADGHVNHEGTMSTNPATNADATNLSRLGLAISQYVQDNDESFPPMQVEAKFEAAVKPYVFSANNFHNPFTGQPYLLNAALSNQMLATLDDPAETWLAKDRGVNPDGTYFVLNADGHVQPKYFYLAQHISVGPNNETRLLWNRGDGMVAFSRVSPTGVEFTRSSLGQSIGSVESVATSASGYTSILIGKNDTASLWTLNPSFYLTQKTDYGPYDGWVPVSVGVGNNNLPRLLWNRYDGSSAVWQASAANDYLSDKRYSIAPTDMASDLAVAPDNSQRLTWTRPSGEVRLWTLSPTGDLLSQSSIPAYYDWKVKSTATGPDGNTRVLYVGTGGSSLLTISPTQQRLNKIVFPAEAGWTPQEVGVGADGYSRILATNVDGRGRLQIFNSSGALMNSHEFAPF